MPFRLLKSLREPAEQWLGRILWMHCISILSRLITVHAERDTLRVSHCTDRSMNEWGDRSYPKVRTASLPCSFLTSSSLPSILPSFLPSFIPLLPSLLSYSSIPFHPSILPLHLTSERWIIFASAMETSSRLPVMRRFAHCFALH